MWMGILSQISLPGHSLFFPFSTQSKINQKKEIWDHPSEWKARGAVCVRSWGQAGSEDSEKTCCGTQVLGEAAGDGAARYSRAVFWPCCLSDGSVGWRRGRQVFACGPRITVRCFSFRNGIPVAYPQNDRFHSSESGNAWTGNLQAFGAVTTSSCIMETQLLKRAGHRMQKLCGGCAHLGCISDIRTL